MSVFISPTFSSDCIFANLKTAFTKGLFSHYGLVLLISLFLVSTTSAKLTIQENSAEDKFQSYTLYEALTAELYNQLGEEGLAVDYYIRLSAKSDDAHIAKRATEIATISRQIKKAMSAARRWVELSPDNLEANQYLALLQLRNSRFEESAQQLNKIEKLVNTSLFNSQIVQANDKPTVTKESLKFIGSMLVAEAHHDKAYAVFKTYLKEFSTAESSYSNQQKLISAKLAIKAKKYSDVIDLLENIKQLDRANVVDVAVMKAKAFKRLNRSDQAILALDSIKDFKETKDSSRLELVRLLVLNKRKQQALPILTKLVNKHKKNNDLLKSLIALQIDRSQFEQAELNIQTLLLSDKYRDEAIYFKGELFEKKGQLSNALENYNKVKNGAYLHNAHKKTIFLTKKLNGHAALTGLFSLKQREASKAKDKAYWIKLQADSQFDAKQYELAMTSYNQAIKLSPKNNGYYYHRGLLNERVGNFQQAEKDFNVVIKQDQNKADALNALGYMLSLNTQRLSEAKKYIQQAFSLKPNDPVIMDSWGYVLFKTGDLVSAEKYLRQAFKAIKNPEVASHLISVLAKTNQHQEAQRIYDEMVKKFPNNEILKKIKRVLQLAYEK